jgi:nifR3 family TIM-barrel protein
MVKIDALVRHDPNTYTILDYSPSMHPIGAQLCGSKPKMAREAAQIIEDLGFDIIDLNCGCPVDKVTKDGSGSGLLKTPDLIGDIVSEIKAAVKIPVTVKIRAGWDEQTIVGPQIVKIAEEAGAAAIAVHGRTRAQGYKGPANWDYIRDCKAAAENIIVIGNGDVFDPESAERMLQYTKCDAVLVSRGTLGQPWIAEDILRHLRGEAPVHRTPYDLKQAILDHFEIICGYANKEQALLDFRRVSSWYLKRCIGAKELRMGIMKSASPKEAIDWVNGYAWDTLIFSNETPAEMSQ